MAPSITFTTVSVRRYNRILGDSPCCKRGAPIALGNVSVSETVSTVDQFEAMQRRHGSTAARKLSKEQRRELLLDWNVSETAIAAAERKNGRSKRLCRSAVTTFRKMTCRLKSTNTSSRRSSKDSSSSCSSSSSIDPIILWETATTTNAKTNRKTKTTNASKQSLPSLRQSMPCPPTQLPQGNPHRRISLPSQEELASAGWRPTSSFLLRDMISEESSEGLLQESFSKLTVSHESMQNIVDMMEPVTNTRWSSSSRGSSGNQNFAAAATTPQRSPELVPLNDVTPSRPHKMALSNHSNNNINDNSFASIDVSMLELGLVEGSSSSTNPMSTNHFSSSEDSSTTRPVVASPRIGGHQKVLKLVPHHTPRKPQRVVSPAVANRRRMVTPRRQQQRPQQSLRG